MAETQVVAPPKTLKMKVAVKASAKAVWKALTDEREIVKWFPRKATLDVRAGGSYELHFGDTKKMAGKYLEVIPEKKLSFTWNGSYPAIFLLEDAGSETIVTLEVEGYQPEGKGLQGYIDEAKGWTFYVVNLKSYLEKGWDIREQDSKRTWNHDWINSYD